MPMSFGSLLGGIVTLVGTSPNIIVSRRARGDRRRAVRHVRLRAGRHRARDRGRRLPELRLAAAAARPQGRGRDRRRVQRSRATRPRRACRRSLRLVGKTVGELEAMAEGESRCSCWCAAARAARARRTTPTLHGRRHPADRRRAGRAGARSSTAGLKLAREDDRAGADTPTDEIGVMEAVVSRGLAAGRPHRRRRTRLHERFGVNLLAVSRRGQRITQRLRAVRLRAGDVIVLHGNLPTPAGDARRAALPAAGGARPARSGGGGRSLLPVLDPGRSRWCWSPPTWCRSPIAFFGAAVAILLIARADAARSL